MDDFVIYVSAKLLRNAARQINLTNRKIEKWEEKSGFKMSTDKTKMVIFYRNKRWLNDEVINITLNGHMIPVEENYKFLGVIFDAHLNWDEQITNVKTKCNKGLNIL